MKISINYIAICHYCKNKIKSEDYYVESNNIYACSSCASKHLSRCIKCDKKEFDVCLYNVKNSDDRICESCFIVSYGKCTGCGEILKKKDGIIKYSRFFCIECFKITFVKCHKCKREIIGFKERIYTGLDEHKYCAHCFFKIYFGCFRCHGIFYLSERRLTETDEWLCPECFRRNSIIHEYSYLPKLKFFCKKEEVKNAKHKVLFTGIEVEVGKTKYNEKEHPEKFLKYLKTIEVNEYFFLKKDSSISAFEIVSHPFSLKFAKEKMKIDKIVKWLISEDYNLSNCGLHIHLDRNYFSEDEIIKMRVFFSRFKNELFLISGRESPSNKYCLYEKYCLKTISNLVNQKGRHCAFNINTNKNTVEIRIFKGTFDYQLILAYLEFCHCFSDFIKTFEFAFISQKEKKDVWKSFAKISKKYSNFNKLLKQKGLL